LFALISGDSLASPIRSVKSRTKSGALRAALTFDDGPKAKYTEELLTVLREKRVKATFFLLGIDVYLHSDDVKKIAADGHVIANHSMTHSNLKKMSFDEIRVELNDCSNLLESIIGKRPRFMRPPGGQYNTAVLKACDIEKLVPVFWTNNPGDYSDRWETAEALSREVIKFRRNGDIILLHLGLPLTVEALPKIIDSYHKAGYKFVTMDELK
jgi:peptidoglycan/xylan/chitin deacetylase (PgdA/CDA1 family)